MSLLEAEMFLNKNERSLKDSWELTGNLLFDADVLLDTIIMKAGELAPLYANVAMLYKMNHSWFNRHRLTFQKWWEVVDDPYNPLWTNDSFVQITEDTKETGDAFTRTAGSTTGSDDRKNSSIAHDHSKDEDLSYSKTRTDDHVTKDQNKGEVENGVSAYDSSLYSPKDKTETRDAHTSNTDGFIHSATEGQSVHNVEHTSGDATIGHSSSTNEGTSDTINTNERLFTHTTHTYGNNSVMMTGQKLVLEEIKARSIDLYDAMADIFVDELCVRVWI